MSRTPLRSRMGALAALCAFATSGPAAAQTYITFSALDGYDTYAYSINAAGVITGAASGTDTNVGFVRAADGTISTFTVDFETVPTAINRKGSIAGYYCAMVGPCHGFLRKLDGKIISFDPAGSTYTIVSAIEDSGAITGTWSDANLDFHGFVRAPDGTITNFDPDGSIYTEPTAINANGDIAGWYEDASNNVHGFLRTADGTITSLDVKGASSGTGGTVAYGINRRGKIVGWYGGAGVGCDVLGNYGGGFERTAGGKIKVFAIEGAIETQPVGIDDNGQITGCYGDSNYLEHGFVGSPKSGFVSFDVPNGSETQPFAVNASGVITGSYYDPGTHSLNGFVRTPWRP